MAVSQWHTGDGKWGECRREPQHWRTHPCYEGVPVDTSSAEGFVLMVRLKAKRRLGVLLPVSYVSGDQSSITSPNTSMYAIITSAAGAHCLGAGGMTIHIFFHAVSLSLSDSIYNLI